MKKFFALFGLPFFLLACSHKTIVAAGTKPNGEPDVLHSTANAPIVAQGRAVYVNRCGRCHGLKPVNKYTAQEWKPLLKIMTHKARLNEADSIHVTAYVMANAR